MRALAIGEKALGPEDPDVAIYVNNLGVSLRAQVGAVRNLHEISHGCVAGAEIESQGKVVTFVEYFLLALHALLNSRAVIEEPGETLRWV